MSLSFVRYLTEILKYSFPIEIYFVLKYFTIHVVHAFLVIKISNNLVLLCSVSVMSFLNRKDVISSCRMLSFIAYSHSCIECIVSLKTVGSLSTSSFYDTYVL